MQASPLQRQTVRASRRPVLDRRLIGGGDHDLGDRIAITGSAGSRVPAGAILSRMDDQWTTMVTRAPARVRERFPTICFGGESGASARSGFRPGEPTDLQQFKAEARRLQPPSLGPSFARLVP